MLPSKWRLVVRNNTGGSVTAMEIKSTPWKFDGNGEVEYGVQYDHDFAGGAPSNGNFASEDTEKDNAVDKYFGIKGTIQGTGGSSSGALELYIEWPNANGDYPSAEGGAVVQQDCVQIAALTVVGGRRTNFTYE